MLVYCKLSWVRVMHTSAFIQTVRNAYYCNYGHKTVILIGFQLHVCMIDTVTTAMGRMMLSTLL